MSVGYVLVNVSKKEIINFFRLPVRTKGEICNSGTASRIIAFYMIENAGDTITFVPDHFSDDDWRLEAPPKEVFRYKNVTGEWIDNAEEFGILHGRRKDIIDEYDKDAFLWVFDEG